MDKKQTLSIIEELLTHLDLNAKQFSESLNLGNPQWLYNVLNPELPTGLSKNKVNLICETYPEINKSYLLTGEGTLLKAGTIEGNIQQNINSSHITQSGNVEASANMDKLINVLAEQSQQVTKAQEQIDRLITLLERNSKN